jgi:TetR/AcrR family transcriptional regulator
MDVDLACQLNNKPIMKTRVQQREDSRQRIVEAAISIFSEFGYHGGSTRDIATRAGLNQGLVTYHFQTKDELWRAAANHIFARVRAAQADRLKMFAVEEAHVQSRALIRDYVRVAAAHPELFRLMVEEGKHPDERMVWLVETHIRPLFDAFKSFGVMLHVDAEMVPNAFYALIGAASVIFAVAPECSQLTGQDPTTEDAIERHANFVARLMVPDQL